MEAQVLNNGAEVVADPERPDLGRFLRATRQLRPGDLVLREPPLLRAPRCGSPPPEVTSPASALRAAGLFVPGGTSAVVLRLRAEAPNESDDNFFVRCALHFNSFAAGAGGCDRVTFATLARANHSCRPNCIVDGDEGTMRALRDVAPGEDLTVSYLGDAELLQPRHRRQAELAQRWDFVCGCERCAAPLDDARRWRSCRIEGCGGDLLAAGADSGPAMRCGRCGAVPAEAEARALLAEEAAAARALERAQSGDLEEEDEGQELMRGHRFASKHPLHAVAMELAHDFAFPDALPAQRALLAGLETVLPGLPCELAVAAGRQLAELLEAQGKAAAARESLEAAAAVACVLDGRADPLEVLEEWRRPRPRRTPHSIGGPSAPSPEQRSLDLDLDLGPAPPPKQPPPGEGGRPASDAAGGPQPAAPGAAECAGDAAVEELAAGEVSPLQSSSAQWAVPAALALAVAAAAALAGAWALRKRSRG